MKVFTESTQIFLYHPKTDNLIDVGKGTHIGYICSHLQSFGLTKEDIEEVYSKYNEPVETEGKARDEILKKVLKDGWIRVRKRWGVIYAEVYDARNQREDLLKFFRSNFIFRVDVNDEVRIFDQYQKQSLLSFPVFEAPKFLESRGVGK